MRLGALVVSASLVASLQLAQPLTKMSEMANVVSKREKLVPEAVAWCVANGALYALKPEEELKVGKSGCFAHAPFALFPFDWPQSEYDRVREMQPLIMQVYDAVARDEEWLCSTLAETVASDAFTARLMRVYKEHRGPQKVSCGLIRSDYMLDTARGALQVEVNTIAASFGCLSSTITDLHNFIQSKAGAADLLPVNPAREGLAKGLAVAHAEYLAQRKKSTEARMVFVVQPEERNQLDQRKLEYELWETHGIRVERLTLVELSRCASLKKKDAVLEVTSPHTGDVYELSVAYMRSGYSPDEYHAGGDEWAARELLEGSLAIKCPTAAYQLAGTKKVQQALAAPGVLEKFCGAKADEVRSVFAGLYDLDEASKTAEEAVQRALKNPENFVLKPQREGGGNNFYGDDLKAQLETMSPTDRAAFILMDRINPPPTNATLVRDEAAITGDCVAELGIYGTLVTDGERVLINEACGHLLRQKLTGVDEGGVAAGFAVLSSPRLV